MQTERNKMIRAANGIGPGTTRGAKAEAEARELARVRRERREGGSGSEGAGAGASGTQGRCEVNAANESRGAWRVTEDGLFIVEGEGEGSMSNPPRCIAVSPSPHTWRAADAHRIVECVNSLRGISDPAAVAELIEADREYDEARAAANADDYGARKVYERLEAAQHRRAAALARVQGGAL